MVKNYISQIKTTELPSFMRSQLSIIVMIVVTCTVVMQLINFYRTGEVMDIFKSLSDMALWAYLQRSLSQDKKWQSTTDNGLTESDTDGAIS